MLWNIVKTDFIQCTVHIFCVIDVVLNPVCFILLTVNFALNFQVFLASKCYLYKTCYSCNYFSPASLYFCVFYYRNEPSDCNSITYWNLKVRTVPEGACPDGHNRLQQ